MNTLTNRPPFWTTVTIIAKREVVTRFLSKSFIISTVVTLGLMLLLVIIAPQIGRWMSGTTTVATTTDLAPIISQLPDVEVTAVADADAATELVRSEDVKAAVLGDPENPMGVKVLALTEVPDQLLMTLSVSPSVELLDPDAPNPAFQYFLSLGVGMAWMMAAITYGMSIAQSVVEEKQTRIVEILLATITSKALLTGKIIGSSLAALTQILALAITAFIGMAINGDSLPITDLGIPILWFVVLFIFGFLMVAAMFAAAASLVSSTEDLSNVLQPFIWIVMLPYFGVIFANSNPIALAVMSYIPISAPAAVPMRIFLNQCAAWEPYLSLALLVGTTVAITWLAARIYDRGLLRTGTRMKWKEALKTSA